MGLLMAATTLLLLLPFLRIVIGGEFPPNLDGISFRPAAKRDDLRASVAATVMPPSPKCVRVSSGSASVCSQ